MCMAAAEVNKSEIRPTWQARLLPRVFDIGMGVMMLQAVDAAAGDAHVWWYKLKLQEWFRVVSQWLI